MLIVRILKYNIIHPSQNFRGMSYGEWVTVWCNWLFSEDPDTYNGGDILFLRGNLNYSPVNKSGAGPRFIDPRGVYDRTGKYGQIIFEGTSIFVPVVVAMFISGELYEGTRLKTPEQLRYSANSEIDKGGPMWTTIMKKGNRRASKIVNNLREYRVVTPLFRLIVPQNSLLNDKSDAPYTPGVYDMAAAGFFLLITSLPPATYRINFGGKSGVYHTDSVYDITIEGKRREILQDVSSNRGIFKTQWT
jgi:hypothetical protein